MIKISRIIFIFILPLFLLTGCFGNDLGKQREMQAGKGDSIIIGVPVPYDFAKDNTDFLNGLKLALEDINSHGGVNGKKIKLEIADDRGVFKDAVDTAQDFSENTRMTAVIGHWFSDICIPVASIYEEAGMPVIVPTVSNPELMEKDYHYIFQNLPSDKKVAEQMCLYAKKQEYNNMVIYYEDSLYGRNLAKAFEEEAQNSGIEIIDRRSGMVSKNGFKRAYYKWNALNFDAVFLALNMPEGAQFIKQFRKLDPGTPILSGDGLDVSNLIKVLGEDAENLVISTIYNPCGGESKLKEFKKHYRQKYKEEPDVWAIQGYDSLQLIARAIKKTGSCSPVELTAYLRNTKAMKLVSGNVTFNDDGEIQGRKIYKKKVVNREFEYID
ncbi:MAG: ABC transporter substrate-binding protein [Clostridiales bacterium]|nr:ABC transporter substrate-binding protein [Clostridiales bacterium]MCF8022340.1 ABC transporter substrate-binding protein [Clostridiales bacterium]